MGRRDRQRINRIKEGLEAPHQGILQPPIEGEDIYLSADASFAAAQRLANEQADTLPITLLTLKRRLQEKGFLASTERDGNGERLEIRKVLQGGGERSCT